MVRASHLTENRKSASIGVCSFVATVALNCSSSVDCGEDSYQVRGQWIVKVNKVEYLESAPRRENIRGSQDLVGNVKVHPSVFLALSTVCVEILKLRLPSIIMSWVAVVSSSCFIHSSMASNILQVSLISLTLPTHMS